VFTNEFATTGRRTGTSGNCPKTLLQARTKILCIIKVVNARNPCDRASSTDEAPLRMVFRESEALQAVMGSASSVRRASWR
jgi:hypothetical protein